MIAVFFHFLPDFWLFLASSRFSFYGSSFDEVIQDDIKRRHCRFTLAHELGHCIIPEHKNIALQKTNSILRSKIEELEDTIFHIFDKIVCADNLDDNPKCEVIGKYDYNKVGNYKLLFKKVLTIFEENVKSLKA